MPFKQFTSKEKLTKSLSSSLTQIPITSLTGRVNLKDLYIRANVLEKFKLNTCRVPSIKLILKEDCGSAICFYGFGNIATSLDSCSVGDTLFVLECEVDIAPNQSRLTTMFQLLADDRVDVKPIIWLLKNNQEVAPEDMATGLTETRGKADATKQSYVYTPLSDLKINTKVNVYGLITHMKEMLQTRSNDKHLMLNITDQSMPSKESILTCNLFHSESEKLPAQAQVGDVVRFHRLKIQSYSNKLQATSGPGFHWLYFRDSFDNISSSSTTYTLEDQDKERVQALFEWSQSNVDEVQNLLDEAELSSDKDSETTSAPSSSSNFVPSTSRNDEFRKSEQESSTYQTLREIKIGTQVNVFGIVIYVKPLVTTKRLEFHQMMNITDHSLLNKDDKVTCNLFNANQSKLPYMAEVGDVIRLKDLKIQYFQGKKQGNGNVDWALFRGSSEQPLASTIDFVPNSHEKSVMAGLRKWWHEGPESISFSQTTPKKYFNVVCQVIGVYFDPNNACRIVRVWDGTAFRGPILKKSDAEMSHQMRKDVSLERWAGDLAIDLFLYDNHATSTDFIEPGVIIKVTNLHANVVSGNVEMTLHGGTKYNKGCVLLSRDEPEAKNLLDTLKSPSSQWEGSPSERNKNSNKRQPDAGQPDDEPSPSKKLCRSWDKKNEDERDDLRWNLSDSCNWYNSSEAELALAEEYNNIPSDAELSECDRYAIEAILAKNKTRTDDTSLCDKNFPQAGSSKQATADESQQSASSSQVDREAVNDNSNCKKRYNEDCDIIEGTSDSSSEASPSIWLSLYNSPASEDEMDLSGKKSSKGGNSKSSCHSKCRKAVGNFKSTDNNNQPSETEVSLSLTNYKASKLKESSQSEAPIKIIRRDNSNYDKSPRMRIEENVKENVSSQDSFMTAFDELSPHRKGLPQCLNSAGSSPIQRVKSSKSFLTLRQNRTRSSQESMRSISGFQESDNTISSSLDRFSGKEKDECEVSSSTDSQRSDIYKSSSSTPVDEEPLQCMLETVTGILDHPKVQRSKLSEVLHHKVPHKFKILVRMLDYKPKPTCAGDLVHFCCHICNSMIKAKDLSAPAMRKKEKLCLQCTAKDSVMQPVIILNFLVSDGKYDLLCHLWKSYAVQFFNGIEPQHLLTNEDCFREVQHYLEKVCPANTNFNDKPFMECCIFSYHVKKEVHYQIFDTVVV